MESKCLTQWGWDWFPWFWTYRENEVLVEWGFGKATRTL